MDVRFEDYLNDKLQTFADFDTLDSLISNIDGKQQLLLAQLEEARDNLGQTTLANARHSEAIAAQAQTFQQQQADIGRRLFIVTASDTADDAAQRFQTGVRKVQQLDLASGYFQLLLDIAVLTENASQSLAASPDDALRAYARLRNLATQLATLQEQAEGAAPHLLDHAQQQAVALHGSIKAALTKALEAILKKILWPKPNVAIPDTLLPQWQQTFKNLISLQLPSLVIQQNVGKPQLLEALFPFEVLVQPLRTRFEYHFTGDRPTNRPDKPEYFLSHVLDMITTYSTFVDEYTQPVLFNALSPSSSRISVAYLDATTCFIAALLPILHRKLDDLLPRIARQPQLLSHLMQEIVAFDRALRDEWMFSGTQAESVDGCKGLAWYVLTERDWFDRWLDVEKDFAIARYEAIIDTADGGQLDYDSLDMLATKPTKAAIRVVDLLETITERYRPLSSFRQKLRFLIEIQLAIFDRLHARLHSGLEAFLSLTSTIGRTVQGVSSAEEAGVQGIEGLDRLCRIFGSAEYLERTMQDWSDDVFFLDLWAELQGRARDPNDPATSRPSSRTANKSHAPFVAGSMSLSDIASRTSNSLNDIVVNLEDDDNSEVVDGTSDMSGAIFDETATAYSRLRDRAEMTLIDRLTSNVREAMRIYIRSNPRSSLSLPSGGPNDTDSMPRSPSPDLLPALQVIEKQVEFLSKALGITPLRRITRALAKTLGSHIFDRVLNVHSFGQAGGKQAVVDIEALVSLLDRCVGCDIGRRGLAKCLDASRLLALPLENSSDTVDDGTAWEEDDGRSKKYDLIDVEKRVFSSNEEAREILEELELDSLSESEARSLLQRRVDLKS